jgi:DNA invertase Pin-like site-specific DNA recombinase
MKQPQRCAILARVSTDHQDTESQLDGLRAFASQQGWVLTAEYIDVASGSGRKARPQFDACMLAASQRKFDVLLFWSLDRLSREGIVKTIGYLEQLKTWGVGWRSYTQPFLDTGHELANSIVLSVLAALAKQQRIDISERTRTGLAKLRAKGVRLGRPEKTGTVSRQTEWRRAKAKLSA